MVQAARELVHTLVQGAAKRDIQLLDPSADRKNRQVTPNRFAD